MHERVLHRLRTVGNHPWLLPTVALALRARCLRESARFFVREATGRRVEVDYRLRRSGLTVALRHGTGDVVTLGEVWHNRDYDPPGPVVTLLGATPRVLDLGGNIGLFALRAFETWPRASVTSYEPDAVNADVARRSRRLNHLEDRWSIVQAAAGNEDGEVLFAAGHDALSHVMEAGEDDEGAVMVEVTDVLDAVADSDLVKMDVEGGEWAILSDPRWERHPPRVLVLEYHPSPACQGADPHIFVRERLAAAGMSHQEIWRRADGHGMLWAWQA